MDNIPSSILSHSHIEPQWESIGIVINCIALHSFDQPIHQSLVRSVGPDTGPVLLYSVQWLLVTSCIIQHLE